MSFAKRRKSQQNNQFFVCVAAILGDKQSKPSKLYRLKCQFATES